MQDFVKTNPHLPTANPSSPSPPHALELFGGAQE